MASADQLGAYIEQLQAEYGRAAREVLVCGGTGCRANHGLDVAAALREALADSAAAEIKVRVTGCHGFCAQGPLVVLLPEGILYVSVKPEDAAEIVARSVEADEIVERLTYQVPGGRERIAYEREIPFYARQQRVVFGKSGRMDPGRIEDYLARGGYGSLASVLEQADPEDVIATVEKSGLQGRGGAGFPTGRKWRACRNAQGSPKYVICNGDEGDPGAFMDRSIMEGNPHAVLEGMAIGGYAIGASRGYIYVRQEYPLAVENLQVAINQARERGTLGRDILGTGFDFDVVVNRGAGAFVCGESTALLSSLEGRAGEPRNRAVYPTEKGLFDRPTCVNNVETWATIPVIIEKGWQWLDGIGTATSKGTKVFSVVGKVKNTGLVEVAMGTTLREIIHGVCGGVAGDRPFKAVQTGGPSGGCLPESLLDLPVDFQKLAEAGSMMGSGGMIVMDDRTCVVEVARYFTEFLVRESCGKCTACREGVREMLGLLEKITAGQATLDDIDTLEELADYVGANSICGLGKTAPNPVKSTLRYFRDEYVAHVLEQRCPAGVCPALTRFAIDPDKCKACGKCIGVCPVEAIARGKKTVHTIDEHACVQCGSCRDVCPFDAVTVN